MSALFGLPQPLIRGLAMAMVAAVVALVAWALQLMQAANDRQEFSLMLAGCMVCSAAVGLSTVMVLTFTSPESFSAHLLRPPVGPLPTTAEAGEPGPGLATIPWPSPPLQGLPPS
ncbi:MAG: hypothetical protein VKP70_10920 [Cyanobacteriota bacterium]|nr:hypothetical protein [Cyanobacteriota bacterium]